jgi:dolichyl-phosphate-mannose--protein O-mannosyl transferase
VTEIPEYIKNLFSSVFADYTTAVIFPIVTVFFLLVFFLYYIKILQPKSGTTEWVFMGAIKSELTFLSRRFPLEKRDIVPLAMIAVVFSFLAFFNLGNMTVRDVLGEQSSVLIGKAFMNNMVFDEVYFVRTAAEHLQNIDPFEIARPPLGKELIAASMLAFGMSPFGWRFLGAFFGVLMLIIMYLFIKNMFGKTSVALCGTLLLGFDFMRFVQTRIATVDAYAVLFILLAFYFIYRYMTTDADAQFQEGLTPLALSGLFFGLAFSVKWIGFYAGAGLLIIYTIRLVQLRMYYQERYLKGFGKYLTKTLFISALFFVVIPVIIYCLSYIPYGFARGMTISGGMLWNADYYRLIWDNQVLMFSYHSTLEATHPYSSAWWQWILNIRPILYVDDLFGNKHAIFGAFGNPVVWWGGFIAMALMVVRVFTHRDGRSLFILIGYLSLLLPWIAVTRILFTYHYFACTIFLVLALSHVFNTILERKQGMYNRAVYGFTAVSAAVFLLFYPALSGMYMPRWYFTNILLWLPASWPF